MKRISALALLLACSTPAVQAAGTLSASVKLSHLDFTVADLTPADGVAPFYELLPSDHDKTTTSVYRDTPAFFENHNATPFLTDASVTHNFADGASALAKVTGTSVEAQAAGLADATYVIQSSANLVGSFYAALIRISPGTRLTFSGEAELQAHTNCGFDCYAQASLEFDFGYYGEESSYTKTLFSDVVEPSLSFTRQVGLSYANTSTEDQFLGLVVHADVEISSTATAVPEPASAALLLGGGLIAWVAGRARRPGGTNPALD